MSHAQGQSSLNIAPCTQIINPNEYNEWTQPMARHYIYDARERHTHNGSIHFQCTHSHAAMYSSLPSNLHTSHPILETMNIGLSHDWPVCMMSNTRQHAMDNRLDFKITFSRTLNHSNMQCSVCHSCICYGFHVMHYYNKRPLNHHLCLNSRHLELLYYTTQLSLQKWLVLPSTAQGKLELLHTGETWKTTV